MTIRINNNGTCTVIHSDFNVKLLQQLLENIDVRQLERQSEIELREGKLHMDLFNHDFDLGSFDIDQYAEACRAEVEFLEQNDLGA